MTPEELFTASDAALRSVIDRIDVADLDRPAPAEWSSRSEPTIRDTLAAHAYDEAWVPDVVAGRTIEEVGDAHEGDLLGDDPIASYDRINDTATAALAEGAPADRIVHFQYGDYPLAEGLAHLATYRAFQAWLIARYLGIPFHLPTVVLDGLDEYVLPNVEEWRALGVFPPAVDPPIGADRETLILSRVGFWAPVPD